MASAGGVVVAGQTVAVVAAIAAGGFLLFKVINPLGDTAKQVSKDAKSAITDTTGAAATIVQTVTNPFDTAKGANMGAPSASEFSTERSQLRLEATRQRRSFSTLNETLNVTLRVLDQNGNAVPYAEIVGTPNTAMGRTLFGTVRRVTNSVGSVSLYWTMRRILPGVDNNITFVARKTGYNPSAGVTIR